MRIAAYCRVSTDKEEQLRSLEAQKEFFASYARQNGHQLTGLYADEGISGTSLKKRTEFKRLMADAGLGAFDMVAVKDISRFARNTVDFLQSIRALKAMGIQTVFLTANMTTLGDSELVLTIFGAMAQEESANLSKRVKFGKLVSARRGRVPQHVFGYERVDNFTLRIDPVEAETVKKIFRLYVEEGLGFRRIAQRLSAEGDATKFGGAWDAAGVRRILTNSIYCGEYVNHKYEIRDYLTGRQTPVPMEERLHHRRPEWAIVSEAVFDRAQRTLRDRREKYDSGESFRNGRYSARHAFSTLIRCGCCGGSFCRKSYTYANTRVYWKCRVNDQQTGGACPNGVTVGEDELLRALGEYLSSLIGDRPRFVRSIAQEVWGEIRAGSGPAAVEALERKRAALERKREKWNQLYVNELLTMEQLQEKNRLLDGELSGIALQLKGYAADGSPGPSRAEGEAQLCSQVERFLTWEDATNADMRGIIDHISVNCDGKVDIYIKKRGN